MSVTVIWHVMHREVRSLPGEVFINFILVLHPRVSVNKELEESQKRHGHERYQGHCGWDRQGGYRSDPPTDWYLMKGQLTCSSWGRGLHVALRHFGEGIQLLHQAQGFLTRETPHLQIRVCCTFIHHRQITESGLQSVTSSFRILLLRTQYYTNIVQKV